MSEFLKNCVLDSEFTSPAICAHQSHTIEYNNIPKCTCLETCDFQERTIDIVVSFKINMAQFNKHPIDAEYLRKHVENALSLADSDYIRTSKVN
jgi:hypothetical protein